MKLTLDNTGFFYLLMETRTHLKKIYLKNLQIDRTTMVSHIDHLESLGFVKRTRNPKDRRSYSLLITPNGNDVLDSCWEFLINTELEVLAPLDHQERILLKDFLIKIWSAL